MPIPIKSLKLNPRNPRFINDDKFQKLVNSLKEDEWLMEGMPIIVDSDNMILAGNQRYKALEKLGYKELPDAWVKKYDDLTEDQKKRAIIKTNGSFGQHDWDILANEWSDEPLEDWGVDLPTSWNKEEVDEDDAPELDEKDPPKSKLGEIYQLGKHRVMCGSATSEDDVSLLLGEQQIDLYITDPPYNVDYTGKTKEALKIDNDSMDDQEFLAFLTDANRRADEHMKAGAAFYIFHADSEGFNFRASVKDVGWMLKQCLVWVKQSMVMGRQDYQWQHEPILYGWKSGASHSWYSDRKQTTKLEFDRPSRNSEHPTMKPLNILGYLIQNSSKAGDLVFDSFLGSGSTLMAAEATDRVCYGTELDPRYVDVIRKRYAMSVNGGELPDNWEELTPCL